MLAELLVPIFLPGIAFLAVLLVLKPEQRGRWSGLVGGFVLPSGHPGGVCVRRCLAFVLFRLAPLALDLGRGGFALGGLVLVALRRPWVVCPTGLWEHWRDFWCFSRYGNFGPMSSGPQCCGLRQMVDVGLSSHVGSSGRTWHGFRALRLAPMALEWGFTTLMILSASGATVAGALVLAPQSLTPSGGGAMVLGVLLPLLAWCGCSYDYAEAPWWQWAGVAGLPVAIMVFFDPMPSADGQTRRPWLSGMIRAVLVVLLIGWLLQPTVDSLVAPADDPYGSY